MQSIGYGMVSTGSGYRSSYFFTHTGIAHNEMLSAVHTAVGE
jgi:hypothetical protein